MGHENALGFDDKLLKDFNWPLNSFQIFNITNLRNFLIILSIFKFLESFHHFLVFSSLKSQGTSSMV